MKRTKLEKGITLIALIITIIVLLILAVVAINSVNNTGIIKYAQNAADEYKTGRDEEIAMIEEYMSILDEYKPEENPEETGLVLSSKTLSITIGENENLTATFNGTANNEITWSIENSEVATLSATKGSSVTVTAVAKGTTKITATYGEFSAECTVTSVEEKTQEDASIVGIYGSYTKETAPTSYDYYELKENGIGEHVYYGSSPDGERTNSITYTVNESGIGTLTIGGKAPTTYEMEFKVIRSNDGKVENKMLGLGKISGTVAGNTMEGYNQIWTTKGINGLQQKENKTYSNVIDGVAVSWSFENGTIIGSFEDKDTGPYTESLSTSHFIIEYDEGIEVVYAQTDRGCYELSFIILDDTYIIEMYGS